MENLNFSSFGSLSNFYSTSLTFGSKRLINELNKVSFMHLHNGLFGGYDGLDSLVQRRINNLCTCKFILRSFSTVPNLKNRFIYVSVLLVI